MRKKDTTDSSVVKKEAAIRALPLGLTDFANIRQNGHYYADKTKFLYEIAILPDPFFLARPQGFGKTLLVSSLERLLLGQREFFKGLWIDQSDYPWDPYPVIRLDMSEVTSDNVAEIERKLTEMLRREAKKAKAPLETNCPADMFSWLVFELFEKHGRKVAILIDNYDAPIIDYYHDPPKAEKIRFALKQFYGRLKTDTKKTGHIFVTGALLLNEIAIDYSLSGLFDISDHRKFAAICGFTAADLEDLLSDRLERTLEALIKSQVLPPLSDGNDLRQLIMDRSESYSWDGKTEVYNPASVLSILNNALIDA
ncbi:MAG: AAA family ATPase [Deltaproteobacteria bacterium]|jgi:hypothetical protein|nr:AAA family ATPase [Deltaproteobacteria bacterium]